MGPIDHGATVDYKGTFGGLTHSHGITALHNGIAVRASGDVEVVIQRGANPSTQMCCYCALLTPVFVAVETDSADVSKK
jgi:hypothetical protein